MAARRKEALDELARECEAAGGHALAIPLDVADERAVESLARATAETFGRVDAWVNNAAVTVFGRFEEVPTGRPEAAAVLPGTARRRRTRRVVDSFYS
jgi:NAD(P)-dependent dehydrogenase (short-subunit alcohol dehydrogenase family)